MLPLTDSRSPSSRCSNPIPICPISFSLLFQISQASHSFKSPRKISRTLGPRIEKERVPEDRSLRHRRRTPTERKACNRCIVLLGIWAWHRGRWVWISLRLRAVRLIANERRKKKKKMLLRIIVVQRIIKRKFIHPFIPSSNPCLKIVKKTVYR